MKKQLWNSLYHNGVYFTPPYVSLPSNIKILYNGFPVNLTPEQEEPAYLYSKYLGSEYTENKTFNRNFFNDWKKLLGKDSIIKEWDKIDFSNIYNYILKIRDEKKELSKEEKQKIKDNRDKLMETYRYCYIDGLKQPISNPIVEPPEIFKGRGNHPKTGKIKQRIKPENVILNMSKDKEIPKPNIPGNWGNIIEDKTLMWIASWKDSISGKTKYVFLGQESEQRMSKDSQKFDLAKKLKSRIKIIKAKYNEDLKSNDIKLQQIATSIFLIDTLALRVGNEKGSDEAETVGVTSLKIKHVSITDDCTLILDFLGKDCVRYTKKLNVSEDICKNIKNFSLGKDKDDDLFDKINSNDVNKYLQELMKNLTAKVFRTFNASNLFQKELDKIENKVTESSLNEIINLYNMANTKVAELCNHQKKVNKNYKEQLDKINEQIRKIKSKSKITTKDKQKIKELKNKKKLKSDMKNLSLGTSKINYIDPRITIAFFKRHKLPLEKVFNESLMKKFTWAKDVPEDFKF
jgi:DNA topoisomerase-1